MMTKQHGDPLSRNKSLAFHLSCSLHQDKVRKVNTINSNIDLVVDLPV